MDNSLSKALIIVAGVLLAMIVIAFVTFSFRRVGTWATTQEEEVEMEQRDKFNKEYEAYDKPLMYGVDVISCLNKAKSNNDKMEGKYAEKLDKNYEVKVSVIIKKTLQESIIVYKTDGKSREQEAGLDWDSKCKLKDMNSKFDFIKKERNSKFNKDTVLKTVYEDSDMTGSNEGIQYELTSTNKGTNEKILRNMLELSSNNVSETVKNKEPGKTQNKTVDKYYWSKAVYRSPLYDLKIRKFKCTGIEYNPKTGRVSKISFEEYL